jgi:subtilisin family serine protease
VAVVDHGFDSTIPDIAQNTVLQYRPYSWPDSVSHGTSVASVLAARGNNRQGITGAMWSAGLELWSVGMNASGQPTTGSNGSYVILNGVDVLAQAVRGGALVINASIGLRWTTPPAGTRADSARVERLYRNLRSTMRRALFRRALTGAGRPLLVLGAGNGNSDAYWSAYPNLVRDFPEFVMVVGAANPTASGAGDFGGTMTRRATSNWGELIDLYAPGGGVGALDGAGNPTTISGTSFAAPLVSGVAGLLFAFDPRLTAREVKELLLDGAAAGNRSIVNGPFSGGPRDVLNAYESLKAAAQRVGAPICGNRVWARDGQIYVERAGGLEQPVGPAEPTYAPLEVDPLHGGKYVQYRTVEGQRTLQWTADGWVRANPPANAAALRGGTRASLDGFSHDRDTLVWVNTSVVSGTDWWRQSQQMNVELFRTTVAGDGLFSTIQVHNLALPDPAICAERQAQAPQSCTMTYLMSRWWMFRVAYPQNGQPSLVAVSPMYTALLDSTTWQPCLNDPGYQCRDIRTRQKQAGTRIYTVPWGGGTPTELTQIQDTASIFWIGQSEADSTLVLGRGSWRITRWFNATRWRNTGNGEYGAEGEVLDCGIEYRRLAGFAQTRRVATSNACNWDYWDQPTNAGSGTIAASRAPVGNRHRNAVVSAAPYVIRSGGVQRR